MCHFCTIAKAQTKAVLKRHDFCFLNVLKMIPIACLTNSIAAHITKFYFSGVCSMQFRPFMCFNHNYYCVELCHWYGRFENLAGNILKCLISFYMSCFHGLRNFKFKHLFDKIFYQTIINRYFKFHLLKNSLFNISKIKFLEWKHTFLFNKIIQILMKRNLHEVCLHVWRKSVKVSFPRFSQKW